MKMTLIAAVVVTALLPAVATAVPIVYSYAGTGSGTVGTQSFSNAAFTITANADTANILPWTSAGGGPQNTHLSTSIAITGLGSFTITTPSHTWVAQGCCGGLGANLGNNWITLFEPAMVSVGYGLATGLGPITQLSPGAVNQFAGVATTGGALTFANIPTVTFTATVVPEPASVLLMALGLGALGAIAWRRMAAAS